VLFTVRLEIAVRVPLIQGTDRYKIGNKIHGGINVNNFQKELKDKNNIY
jgi:hypothetical protein